MLLGLAVAGMAAGLRFPGLDRVPGPYWDETFYVADASAYSGLAPAEPRPGHPVPEVRENSWMQPPLGKWLIAAGELAIGRNGWGWRTPSALFGTAGAVLAYVLALELTGSLALGGLAGLLVGLDGLEIVQSRIATLDVFSSTLALAGVVALVIGRRGRVSSGGAVPGAYLASGAALGAAVACKWSGLAYLLLAAAMAWLWLPRLRPGCSPGQRLRATAVAFVLVPLAVYLASYTSFFTQNGPDVSGFVRLQWDMLQYGRHFDPGSPAASPAWSWPLLGGSIDYTQAVFPGGGIRIVAGAIVRLRTLAVGNPVLWWAFLAAAPALVGRLVRARMSGRPAWAETLTLLAFGAGWLPWLVPGRTEFVYYLLPAVPFMAVAVAQAVGALAGIGAGAAAPVSWATGAGLSAGAGAAAWAYYPLWTTLPVAYYSFSRLAHLPGVH